MEINTETSSKREDEDKISEKDMEEPEIRQKKKFPKNCLLITFICIIIFIAIGIIIVYFINKGVKEKTKTENDDAIETPEKPETPETQESPKTPETPESPKTPETPESPKTPETPESPKAPETPERPETPETPKAPEKPETPEKLEIPVGPKEKEFDIVTKPENLKHISIVQKSKEEININSNKVQTENIRKTDYDIYIISEEDPDEELSAYFSKMYTGCVSIRSECSSNTGDCQPQPLVDLTVKPNQEVKARSLEDSDKIKDNPIPLCYFHITDNHIITSIKCHESFPEDQKNQILLDLYFFRPPASQRIDKQGDNITLNITEDEITKKTYIRETNGGLCNIYDNFGSLCTTDMNTILDSDKNLISYDEEAITMINYDANNSYRKEKITNLIDISDNIKKEDIENYQNSLKILEPLLENYMVEDEQFTKEDFADFGDRYKDNSKRLIPKKTRNVFRRLNEPKYSYNQMSEIFSQKAKGITANLKLEINPGIDSDIVGAYATFNLDDKKYVYSAIQHLSTINELINKIASVSKAGNQLATELYDRIIDKLEQVLNEITIQYNSLNDLVQYYDLYPIFNSTLSLYAYNKFPNDILKVSSDLLNSLSGIFTQIKIGNIRTYAQILYNDIYNYIDEMNGLIVDMLNNLGNLTITLVTKNNTYTSIMNYYLNETSASYVNIIEKMQTILDNYYIDEYNLIFPKIENLLHSFNESTKESLKKNLTSIKELYNNLLNGSYTINNITTQAYQQVLTNLDNSYNYPKDIINKINQYIIEVINLKQNGYFISDENINIFKNTFTSLISQADQVAQKLNYFQLIDKVFDEIMTKFRDNYIYTVSYMEQIKSKNFFLEEDVLNQTSFTKNIKNQMEEEIKTISDEILTKIKINNNYEKIKNYLISYFEENLDYMNYLMSDLNFIFSEEQLKSLANAFELSLNLSLERITEETDNNIYLVKSYYDEYSEAINDLVSLKKLVQKQMIKNPEHPDYKYYTIYQMIEYDEIKEKEYTSAYLAKYNSFMANLDYSKGYLVDQLYLDIVNHHREIYDSIKEYLMSILNNKLTERLSEFDEIESIKNQLKIIEKLNNRLNKYFSQDAFDKKYLKIINNTVNMNKQKIEEAKEYINSKHSLIKKLQFYDKDYSNDVCIVFKRKICYGCTNCVSYTFFYDRICFVLSPYQYNYLKIKKIEFDTIKNFNNFEEKYIVFDDLLGTKIEKYNSTLNNLTIYIDSLADESFEETPKNISIKYFEPLKKWINDILRQKYQDELVKSTYNYYHQNIDGKLEIIFGDIFNKWKEIYLNLTNDVKNNKENIKSSLFEFSMIGSIYRSIITQELMSNYFNSIILFQRSEFNYTISYYYNYLIKLVDKSYKYILNKIQTREHAFNDTIQEKKEELKNIYDILIGDIEYSEFNYLEIENQLNILQVNDDDFFKVKYFMENNIQETEERLEIMVDEIFEEEWDLPEGDEYSLAMRFYLENKELGKLIQTYYEPIDKEELVNLNLDKFKDVLKENWVFDEGDFIYILNKALFETNRIIKNELSVEMKNYSTILENEITKFFEDNIENMIDELYATQFKLLTSSLDVEVYNNVFDIVEAIYKKINYERKRIEANLSNYNLDKDKIDGIIDNFKITIINRLNNSVFTVLDGFHKNIYNNIYSNCIETRLNQYLNEAKNAASSAEYGEYKLVNSSYKVGQVIYNLTENIVNNYKTMVKQKIDFKYKEYFEKISNTLNIKEKNLMVNFLISSVYRDELSYYLNNYANCTSNKCKEFDFTHETITEINDIINKKMNNITNIMSSIKGSNYEVNFKCNLNFVNSGIKVIKPICDSFKKFLSFENQEQSTLINKYIQDYIKSNLDDFLNNVVPTFGNPFFERIIDYNINFKIVDLYQNLRYAIAQTMLYYYILDQVRDVGDLPSDLKIRLIQLNDLDYTVKIKKEEIKKMLERKLSELIEDLKDTAKETYAYYLKENDIIKNSFSPHFIGIIDYNLEEIMTDLDKTYQNILEKYLKDKFTTSFANILEDKTEEMLNIFYKEKNKLKEKFDVLFSSIEDKDLNEINKKMNLTLESIQKYNNFADSFEITKSVTNFFMKYGNSTLVPLFLTFDRDLNNKMKQLIMSSINEKSSTIENLNINALLYKLNFTYSNILTNYINPVILEIENYGITDMSYNSNLNYTRNKIYELLVGNQNEDDMAEEAKKRVEIKDVEESLNLLLSRAYNNYNGVSNLDIFNYFKDKVNNFIYYLSIDSKKINETIRKNKYNDEISSFLIGKINTLNYFLNKYYNQISGTFISNKKYLQNNMGSIYNDLYYCYYATSRVLNLEYQKIQNNTRPINNKYSNYIQQFDQEKPNEGNSDHMTNYAIASIYNINEYAEFKLDIILEGNYFIRPKVKGKIVDKSKPEKVNLDIYSHCGRCCKEGHIYNITLNDLNYTMNLEYDAATSSINITTYTNIEKYYFTEITYRKEQNKKLIDANYDTILVNRSICSRTEDNFTIYMSTTNEISAKHSNDSIIIIK